MGLLKKQRLYILTAPPGRDNETKRDKVKVYIEYIILYYIQNMYIYIYMYMYMSITDRLDAILLLFIKPWVIIMHPKRS